MATSMIQRLTSAVARGLPGARPQPYTALEPPPAQHVVAAAALAAASAAAAKRIGADAGTALGGGRATSAAGEMDLCEPGLELQLAMQGLMSAARQATTEEALRAEQERRRSEAAAAAEVEARTAEERAARLAATVLHIRLWRTVARWGRREVTSIREELRMARSAPGLTGVVCNGRY
ncbi:hypothetical protein GPECTOR_7g1110 [Gonium pectorale]|uniref:Uncharacterized protein n=1 Tax=Gonium pectorale TaxID=33097 RepID=A0A150GTN0_GONPE|nr:hypothetical protein GPECTOR_7g1110 [Gonium pectorale]|eukprot:KXZ53217.1 hypothetical protein GPECTOR_7g1110 [Gonium pectorale]